MARMVFVLEDLKLWDIVEADIPPILVTALALVAEFERRNNKEKRIICDAVRDHIILFFFKQKTAYEMWDGDWSSDVCSSDLDSLSPETMSRLHGQMRPVEAEWSTLTTPGIEAAPWWDPSSDESVDPWTDSVWVEGIELAQGSAVRLHPSGQADAQDMFLDGRCGTVAGVFADVDGGVHLAVSLDHDPAASELVWQGRYLYFRPDEVEPMPDRQSAEARP
jgi:hypothetical protein